MPGYSPDGHTCRRCEGELYQPDVALTTGINKTGLIINNNNLTFIER